MGVQVQNHKNLHSLFNQKTVADLSVVGGGECAGVAYVSLHSVV